MLPSDPMILLSYINTKLRDEYDSFSELCRDLDIAEADVAEKLHGIGFDYDEHTNRFR